MCSEIRACVHKREDDMCSDSYQRRKNLCTPNTMPLKQSTEIALCKKMPDVETTSNPKQTLSSLAIGHIEDMKMD